MAEADWGLACESAREVTCDAHDSSSREINGSVVGGTVLVEDLTTTDGGVADTTPETFFSESWYLFFSIGCVSLIFAPRGDKFPASSNIELYIIRNRCHTYGVLKGL